MRNGLHIWTLCELSFTHTNSRTVFPFPKKRVSESRVMAVEVKPRIAFALTANPGLETLVKIKKAFPDFPLEVITG